ncbi:unnamed protein product [Parnassius mnemosyne]|uniref:Reverse transcriptase domain-containing protein n=1 Tax=Parnassius mnemosyne TaxID=213953 RepID=A0AAV1KAA0_9NEOP
MEETLKKACKCKKTVVVCGDFNVDILENSQNALRFLNLFKSFNLQNLFCEPTRTTSTTATCLDNIFTDSDVNDKSIIKFIKSDHVGQLARFEHQHVPLPKNIVCRPITTYRLEKFKENINNKVPLLEPNTADNPNDLYGDLFGVIKYEFNNIFTKKTINTNQLKIKFSDWATPGIYKSRKKLYELYETKACTNDPQIIEHTKKYSKMFKKVCSMAKSNYIRAKIQKSDNKIKATWNVINKETCKTRSRDRSFELEIDDKHINTDAEVAIAFESFFTNAPITTTSKLKSSKTEAASLLESCVDKCSVNFDFQYIDTATVLKTFKQLNIKKTEDLWGISTNIIKSVMPAIAPYLAFIFNQCIDDKQFPTLMKYSKIIPLFKAGDKSDPSNFRPISILPALSKIFEKIIFNQLLSHFTYNKLLHEKQFGFTKGRNTTDAGVELVKHIFDAWDKKRDAIGIFCDLSKAFDCVDHETLLLKLGYYGVSNSSLSLLKSYLTGRVQKVNINDTNSSGAPLVMGVPQGSILGPLLFLIYVNDLPHFTKNLCEIVLFADDTSLIFKTDRHKELLDDVNNTLSKKVHWFTSNNLLLNAKKTKCVNFTMPNVRQIDTHITMNDESVQIVDTTVFLGMTLDSKLQWGSHISALAGRLSSAAYAVRKIRSLTDEKTARLVYFSYFHSVMSYGLMLWGSAADIETIFILQKRAIRAIYSLRPRDSLRELFKEINILTVACQYIYDNVLYVRKNLDLFKKNSDVHNYNTRNKNKLVVPKLRLHKVGNSFVGNSIKMFNKIPQDLVDMPLNKFKIEVKKCLMKKGYYKVDEYLKDKNPWSS